MTRRVLIYPDAQGVADAAAGRFATQVADTVAEQGIAHVVLTGGTLGIQVLSSLAASPLVHLIDWTSVHVWWGDERFVPRGDPQRNEGQAQDALLRYIELPEENIHRMGAADEFATAETAAASYLDEVGRFGNPQWDVLLLGLGPDGHVASLFPAHNGFVHPGPTVFAVHDSPKPPPVRITLGRAAINRAKRVWFVVAGEEKSEAVRDCLKGNESYPGAVMHGSLETLWLMDVPASSEVEGVAR